MYPVGERDPALFIVCTDLRNCTPPHASSCQRDHPCPGRKLMSLFQVEFLRPDMKLKIKPLLGIVKFSCCENLLRQLEFFARRDVCDSSHNLHTDPDLNQGLADLQSAALTTELCTLWQKEIQRFSLFARNSPLAQGTTLDRGHKVMSLCQIDFFC